MLLTAKALSDLEKCAIPTELYYQQVLASRDAGGTFHKRGIACSQERNNGSETLEWSFAQLHENRWCDCLRRTAPGDSSLWSILLTAIEIASLAQQELQDHYVLLLSQRDDARTLGLRLNIIVPGKDDLRFPQLPAFLETLRDVLQGFLQKVEAHFIRQEVRDTFDTPDSTEEGMLLVGFSTGARQGVALGNMLEALLYSYPVRTNASGRVAMLIPACHRDRVETWMEGQGKRWSPELCSVATEDLAIVEVALGLWDPPTNLGRWDPSSNNEFTTLESSLQAARQICAPVLT